MCTGSSPHYVPHLFPRAPHVVDARVVVAGVEGGGGDAAVEERSIRWLAWSRASLPWMNTRERRAEAVEELHHGRTGQGKFCGIGLDCRLLYPCPRTH